MLYLSSLYGDPNNMFSYKRCSDREALEAKIMNHSDRLAQYPGFLCMICHAVLSREANERFRASWDLMHFTSKIDVS